MDNRVAHSTRQPLGEVFIANWRQLRHIAYRVVGTADRADDVLQEAYLKLLECSTDTSVERPLCYCCQVVRNMAFDHCRRQNVENTYRFYTDDGEPPPVPCTAQPEQRIHCHRALQAVHEALQTLPERTRKAFELHRVDGLTQREIGASLGCSATLVNFMVKDAMTALEACRSRFEC